MGKRSPEIDAYIAEAPEKQRETLQAVRDLILEADDRLEEGIEYNLPAFIHNGVVANFAARKHGISLYCNMELVEKYRDELGDLDCGKSCIRFKRLDQLPIDTIQKIIRESVEINAKG